MDHRLEIVGTEEFLPPPTRIPASIIVNNAVLSASHQPAVRRSSRAAGMFSFVTTAFGGSLRQIEYRHARNRAH